jgi:dGTPase
MKIYTNWIQAKSIDAKRFHDEIAQKYRNNFQKDRDRILYSKSFRRLSGKTQVFITGHNDHLRTRLTHSLEVNQIAKTISSALNLNLDLTEAIALGHDIGHTPFGHIGERTLNYIMNGCESVKDFNKDLPDTLKGFKHNVQALRVLQDLERSKESYKGLNLSNYTLWGIVNHTKVGNIKCKRNLLDDDNEDTDECYFNHTTKKCEHNCELILDFYKDYLANFKDDESWTFEGLVVRVADEIAQRHHDVEDALLAGLIVKEEIIGLIESKFSSFFDKRMISSFNDIKECKDNDLLSSNVSRFLVNFFVLRIIKDARKNIKDLFDKHDIKDSANFSTKKGYIYKNEDVFEIINFDKVFQEKDSKFQDYLKNKILNSFLTQRMDGKAEYIIRKLFEAYVSNPQQLPDRTLMYFFNTFLGEDYIERQRIKYTDRGLIGGLRTELVKNYNRNNNPKYKHALLRTICDYISGMTDNYAYSQYKLLYGSTKSY